jgi:hypothetical protein
MTATFGPQLLGQTEKTLNALLRQALDGTELDEPLWVSLRLASQPDALTLPDRIANRAKFDNADQLAATLVERGLVHNDEPTADGRALLDSVLAKSAALSGPIWDDIADADAAARALTTVLRRARVALGDPS